ncbi:uncharacterized protein NFIA_069520 [Aspergillus fischeri NRRL 181]|uniref:Uncharacterized protein n=1 Tax=Neosartorya fischeri (strain ATCC 1020 / DSM 3700 / CBS 544.65 / FGSC A1164 / JCM 1740 / NRRL 181 / WB 181) TaxID=331117 RepID=A1D7T7_NEOFI|nr:uncharacterized protein NFIA_069520 [Aspergillus fischeri NRRL 181]EAW21781.1 hypothetical protein NFIA_069520 [Aspergillus fischeri NRRL 181]KAG2024733.1 hypothetical protein GB937_003431 [Aspergillus fischeri]
MPARHVCLGFYGATFDCMPSTREVSMQKANVATGTGTTIGKVDALSDEIRLSSLQSAPSPSRDTLRLWTTENSGDIPSG